jgi:polysaccharide export outer membrane protein
MRKLKFCGLLTLLLVLFWAPLVAVQAISPEEIERLKQLTPAQRDAVIEVLQEEDRSVVVEPQLEEPRLEEPELMREPEREPEPREMTAPQRKKGAKEAVRERKERPAGEERREEEEFGVMMPSEARGEIEEEAETVTRIEERGRVEERVELDRFGYDLFRGVPTTFAPATDIPVPVDYVIGPGDTVRIQLYGKENRHYNLVVTREGHVQFPGIGPVMVTGMRFEELKAVLQDRIAQQMIGEKASITMGPLRSIRVFVLGDVKRPGSYTVSALSTMTNALFASGGITPIGTLRDIQLKRRGRLVTRLDLYDLMLRGDTSADVRLQPGDVIFVPPVGRTVGVDGEVRRPAIYELRKETDVEDILGFAGGLLPTAYGPATKLERISAQGERTIVDLDLSIAANLKYRLNNGDIVRVYSILERMEGIVSLKGHVERPGRYEWSRGMRLTDLVGSVDALQPRADLDYVLIRRELQPDKQVTVLSTSLREALASPASASNTRLEPRDEVFVFGLGDDRKKLIRKLLKELKAQASAERPAQVVSVSGRVRDPGQYPLVARMRVSDLIRAGGGLSESAYTLRAEMTRYEVVKGQYREIAHLKIDMAKILAGDASSNIFLKPHDNLQIQRVPEWVQTATVEVRGEVRFPGVYQIARGEQLSSLLRRAGGLTDFAFPEGAVFMREALRLKEKKQMETLAERLETDLASATLERAKDDAGQQAAIEVGQELVEQLRTTRPVGRLVINLPKLLATSREGRRSEYDVTLKDGDKIFIPQLTQEVTVIGEVFHPTSHLYEKGLDRNEYIDMSGGATRKADARHVYVVRANGGVIANGSSLADMGDTWFERMANKGIRPGDTIVVPMDIDRIRPLTLWTNVSQIVYQMGIAVAAASAVGVF